LNPRGRALTFSEENLFNIKVHLKADTNSPFINIKLKHENPREIEKTTI